MRAASGRRVGCGCGGRREQRVDRSCRSSRGRDGWARSCRPRRQGRSVGPSLHSGVLFPPSPSSCVQRAGSGYKPAPSAPRHARLTALTTPIWLHGRPVALHSSAAQWRHPAAGFRLTRDGTATTNGYCLVECICDAN